MTDWATKVKRQGRTFNYGTAALLDAANKILQNSPYYGKEKEDMTIVQGSYSGSVSASAGTHNGGGAVDLTPYNWTNRSKVLRILGMFASRRYYIKGVWNDHVHGITCGDGTASPAAQRQVAAYYKGQNGLANNGPDQDWRPNVLPILFVNPTDSRGKPGVYWLTKDQTMRDEPNDKGKKRGTVKKNAKFTVVAVVNVKGTLWAINIHGNCVLKSALTAKKPAAPKPPPVNRPSLRVGTFNFPDKEKIPSVSESSRIDRAAQLIKSSDLDVVAFQELVGRDAADDPSSLAERMHDALGKDWEVVVPSTSSNENYFMVRKTFVNVKQHFDDVIIRGGYAGRHVTRVQIDSEVVGVTNLGNTHLVENNHAGASVQSALAASAVAQMGSGQQRILMGDFNAPSEALTGMVGTGLKNSRLTASATTNSKFATYLKYALTTPSINPEWIIDQLWHSSHLVASGYTVVLDLNGSKVRTPRPSDHFLTIAALRKA